MSSIPFCKFHGFGNDYIVIEGEHLREIENLSEFTQKICRRNTGVGADGLAILEKPVAGDADYACRIINPDGSEAGFSGNGTRCAVAYLYYKNLRRENSLRLETKSGIKNYELLARGGRTFRFRAELGKPKFDLPQTPFSEAFAGVAAEKSKGFNILLPGEAVVVNCNFVDVGNPVAVIFLEDFNQIEWRRFGGIIENLTDIFPERTNVVFVKVNSRETIEIRIWERGAGETASSGTCSIAAAVASAYTGKTGRNVHVRAMGGATETVWRDDGEMLITGRADFVFCGEISEP